MNNKYLISACRYLDAVYDISIDEKALDLPDQIRSVMKGMDCAQIKKYWYHYLSEINPDFKDKLMILAEEKRKKSIKELSKKEKKKSIFYRGIKQVVSDDEDAKKEAIDTLSKKVTYRGNTV